MRRALPPLRVALEWFLNPDHLPLLAARAALRAEGLAVELVVPDHHYDGFAALEKGEVELVVNEPLHLVEERSLPLLSHGCFFVTEGGVLMHRAALDRLRAGAGVRIASPVSTPTTDHLCADILRGWLRTHGQSLSPDQVTIDPAGFAHVDNLQNGFDGAWLAFANIEAVDAGMRGLNTSLVSTSEAGIPNFSALEVIGRPDADPDVSRSIARLTDTLDRVIPELKANPAAARQLWYDASRETETPTTDAIVGATLARLRAPTAPAAALWRPMWRYLATHGGDVVDEARFEAMFPAARRALLLAPEVGNCCRGLPSLHHCDARNGRLPPD
eukprot:EG_transcript_19489